MHHPWRVLIGCDAFLKTSPADTLPLYIQCIESLSVEGAECNFEADRKVLEEKVFTYYKGKSKEDSFAAFERYAKVTAILLVAKQIVMWRARVSAHDAEAWMQPFKELAERMSLTYVVRVLEAAQPAQWFIQCGKRKENYEKLVMVWFDNMVVKYLLTERSKAVRKKYRAIGTMNQGSEDEIGCVSVHFSDADTID
eukprot:gnl/MRDRNA2_/MRDRNA2_83529_c0_seq1.p1 gnl/MRDRNA2_/MRDRNA2_83529_c0~~gnl/MRDRNA2_/MRDRNA2_83529_c0_seq1.p1  ORF type:complete len:196 (+),score=31.58 gnl/MRDRNA2_/MRDRNA2_83529_c0_seq1:373-960(+)